MGSKPASQSTTVNSPPPQVLAQYQNVTGQANQVAQTPYSAYSGPLVAGLTQPQTAGIAGASTYANAAQPALQGAAGLTLAGAGPANASPINASTIGQYESPYNQDVINATENAFNNQNTQQAEQLQGNTIGAGAFGGDRAGVAQGILAGQQQTAEAPVIASLNNQNYTQALGEANTQQGVDLGAQQANLARLSSAGAQLGGIGTAAQTAGLQGAGAQIQAGQVAQTTQQAQDTAAYNQFLQQQAYPFQTTQWLANISEGIGSNSGGTSNTSTQSNAAAPIVGGALGLGSLFLNRGGRVGRDAGGGVGGLVIPYANSNEQSWVPQVGGLTMGAGSRMPNAAPANNNAAQSGLSDPLLQQGAKSFGTAFSNSSIGDHIQDAIQDLPSNLGFARGGLVRMRRAVGGRHGYALDGAVDDYDTTLVPDLGSVTGLNAPGVGPLAATNTENWTPDAAFAAQTAARAAQGMPFPQQTSLTPQQQIQIAGGVPMTPSQGPVAPGLVMPASGTPTQPTAGDAGLGALRAAMVGVPQSSPGGGISTYGDLTDAGGAPMPPVRPAGLGGLAPASLDTGTTPPAPSAPVGAPTQLASANGGQSFAAPSGGSMWTAPAYSGPAPQGPAPDPANYPVTQAGQAAFIRDYSAYAGGIGVHPGFAMGVANAEGLGAISPKNPNGASSVDIDPNTGKPFSFGAFQLNVRNGLGNAARAAGIDPADPAQANLANKFAMDYMAKNGIQPWKGDQAVMAYQAGHPGGGAGIAAINAASPPSGGLTAPSRGSIPLPSDSGASLSIGQPQTPDTGGQSAPRGGGILGALGLPGLSDSARMALMSAGFGIMASPSRNLGIAIGQGGLQGVQTYEKGIQLQNEAGLNRAQIANLTSEAASRPEEIALKAKALDLQLAQVQRQLSAGSILAGNGPAPSVGSVAPIAPAGARSAPSTPSTAAPAPLPPSTDDFWQGVPPLENPSVLNARAQQIAATNPELAGQLMTKAQAIVSRGTVLKNGQLVPIPGFADAQASIEAAKAGATSAAQKAVDVPAAIAQNAGVENFKTQNAIKTEAAKDGETGQQMLAQAQAMRDVMFDPRTGAANINTGPLGPILSKVAGVAEQAGVSQNIIKALTGTNPDDAQSVEKFRTALGSESAREDLPGSPVRVAEFQRYLQSVPNAEILPAAFKYLLDTAIIPKAQQQIGAYQAVANLDPSKDNIQKALFDYRQANPWYNPTTAAAARGQTPAASSGAPVTLSASNPDADYAKLPSGAHFVGPDGKQRIKP